MSSTRKVLITGCSDGGLGAALAIAFHEAGLEVYATARDLSKMSDVASQGIRTLQLDVQSDISIAECLGNISELDILVNNAGGGYSMPVSDLSIPEAKKLFDLNVWSYLAVTQAFLPLLLKSKGMIVNNTSVVSLCAVPFQSAYNASKAAMASFSEAERLELKPFGIRVVELKTGVVESNFQKNQRKEDTISLPAGSIYEDAKEIVERTIRGTIFEGTGMPSQEWAKAVVADLLKSSTPTVWRGTQAWLVRIGSMLPFGTLDGTMRSLTGLDKVERLVQNPDI
ncbi:Short-chain dehydrogenase/reductase SDR [Penicillium cf. griseofulvum]|uniref:Short-chain dehydrogenase/reductase SDR n=1 Tax=Penicillium cf. griseofulvum TaxID=2972120 RepID=A0A9W9LYF1_9EURO|nr:Short-chain dehydrogenase/reductase SDR [Penicillium cf. griseofulvum]KAJ5442982.1 Short-chain dehydrogenase/reductase SDR [Penicillium cf. griseofulvum]KAJ5451638.1 Short-chain dehydrogenase/reductase SDR [Penicillium cf. griseofulvum]